MHSNVNVKIFDGSDRSLVGGLYRYVGQKNLTDDRHPRSIQTLSFLSKKVDKTDI